LIHVTIQVDPLIYQALGELASLRTRGNTAQLIRDSFYTTLWNAQRGPSDGRLRHSLSCPSKMHDQNYRLKNGKVVEVDAWGLEINDELRRDIEACRNYDNYHKDPMTGS
jgi:hypothetical protein